MRMSFWKKKFHSTGKHEKMWGERLPADIRHEKSMVFFKNSATVKKIKAQE